jgi:catechol 2,3-dioxygenase-like lactoylglutathione lyase family enzyme
MYVHAILETSLYANDVGAARQFYQDVMGLVVVVYEPERYVFFRCGQGMLLVFHPEVAMISRTLNDSFIPQHGANGPGHIAFAINDSDLQLWRDQVKKYGIPIESEIAWPQGGHSIYVRDPAGNSVELAMPSIWK